MSATHRNVIHFITRTSPVPVKSCKAVNILSLNFLAAFFQKPGIIG
jgi:hypothetical protein